MSFHDLTQTSPSSRAEHSHFDRDLTQIEPHSPTAARHVPLDHFTLTKSHLPSPNDELRIHHDQSGDLHSTNELVEEKFRLDRFLQEEWDKAAKEGISIRQTGVAFQVWLRLSHVRLLIQVRI